MAPPIGSNSLAGCTVVLAGSHTVCSDLSSHSIGKITELIRRDLVVDWYAR